MSGRFLNISAGVMLAALSAVALAAGGDLGQAEIERRLGPWLAASSGRPLVAGLAELRAADVPAHAALLWTLVTRGEALAPLTARVAAELELKVAASAWSERGAQRSGSIAAP